jgi:hypothetical protein
LKSPQKLRQDLQRLIADRSELFSFRFCLLPLLDMFAPCHLPLVHELWSGHHRQRCCPMAGPFTPRSFTRYAPALFGAASPLACARGRPRGRSTTLRVVVCLAAVPPVPLLCAVLLRSRSSRYVHVSALATVLLARVLAFAGMRLTHGFAADRPLPLHCTFLLRSRSSPDFHVRALATMLLALWRRSAYTPHSCVRPGTGDSEA